MPIVANGVTVTAVYVNGTLIDDALGNGTDVYDTGTQTDAPSISTVGTDKKTATVRFTNNDASAVTMYADFDQADPTTNRGTVQPSEYVDVVFTSNARYQSFIAYAKAQASGETMSTITQHSSQTG